jgi:hypothetical protein
VKFFSLAGCPLFVVGALLVVVVVVDAVGALALFIGTEGWHEEHVSHASARCGDDLARWPTRRTILGPRERQRMHLSQSAKTVGGT